MYYIARTLNLIDFCYLQSDNCSTMMVDLNHDYNMNFKKDVTFKIEYSC